MNINKYVLKTISVVLCLAMVFGSSIPTKATEIYVSGNVAYAESTSNDQEWAEGGSRYEDIEVTYSQASSYKVTIPKTIALDANKHSSYSIKVEGDIAANEQICVVPVDGIADTEVLDFYMYDQTSIRAKDAVPAEINQSKFYWDSGEAAASYEETDNHIVAEGLSAGNWKGIFQMEISLRTDASHIHNYVGVVTKEPTCTEEGEKTYTCDCGDSYTETIPAKGHNYKDGECTDCGEKDPDHVHRYTESITKEPTCTEAGEKTYTCVCGDSYTETIPAKGHNYKDGECTDCGDKDPNYHTHKYVESITKEPTCTEAGEKTYTCDCGDSYTETIPAKGHNYKDGTCTDCGEKDPNHVHSYTESITKEPTCTEAGEKTYTCVCGDSYTETIPAKGHNYEDGTCTDCGAVEDPYAVAPANAQLDWVYKLNETDGTITLNYYIGSKTNVIVYSSYELNGKRYQTKIGNYGDSKSYYMFNWKTSVTSVKFGDNIDFSDTTNMHNMFQNCRYLTEIDFGNNFDTSNVVNMSYMFINCEKLPKLDVSGFNTSKVTNMEEMFYGCKKLPSIDLSNFDTGSVTNMSQMFAFCESLEELDLGSFDTSNTTNMSSMFGSCYKLTSLDLSNFDTSNVTNMYGMFNNCRTLTSLNISSFDTSKATDMSWMFYACQAMADIDVTNFDTSNVTNMYRMFSSTALVTLDLSSFDTRNVSLTNMYSTPEHIFSFCNSLKTVYVPQNKWTIPNISTSKWVYTEIYK